jgi:hypothetical protein
MISVTQLMPSQLISEGLYGYNFRLNLHFFNCPADSPIAMTY